MSIKSIALALALSAALFSGCSTHSAGSLAYRESQFASRLDTCESASKANCKAATAIERERRSNLFLQAFDGIPSYFVLPMLWIVYALNEWAASFKHDIDVNLTWRNFVLAQTNSSRRTFEL
jgi:hypothetical protein